MVKIENQQISVSCPKCKAKNKVTIHQVTNEETISCVGCGVNINLKDKNGNVKEGTKRLQNKLDELHRAFR